MKIKKVKPQPQEAITATRLRFSFSKKNYMNRILTILTVALPILLVSCSEEASNSGYPVNFVCDASIHPYNIVQGYGEYITIKRSGNGTEYIVNYREGDGEKEQTVKLSAFQLQQGTFHYGRGGLIIGTPSAFDGNKWAFDLACPKCDLVNRRVTIEQPIGQAYCKECSCRWDLNSGGIPIEGDTRPLWRYRVAENPPNIIIMN